MSVIARLVLEAKGSTCRRSGSSGWRGLAYGFTSAISAGAGSRGRLGRGRRRGGCWQRLASRHSLTLICEPKQVSHFRRVGGVPREPAKPDRLFHQDNVWLRTHCGNRSVWHHRSMAQTSRALKCSRASRNATGTGWPDKERARHLTLARPSRFCGARATGTWRYTSELGMARLANNKCANYCMDALTRSAEGLEALAAHRR
jgi:hypothetical protein